MARKIRRKQPDHDPVPLTTTAPFLGFRSGNASRFGFAPSEVGLPADSNELVLHSGDSHIFTVGATGSGKTNLLIANLLLYEGSAIVLDVRGDAARATARFRREVLGQAVYVLDPFGVTGLPTHRLDPLELATLPRAELETESQSIAATLAADHRSERDPYWAAQAASLIGSAVAHLLSRDGHASRTMNDLVDLLFGDDTAYEIAKLLDSGSVMNSFAYSGLAAFIQLPDNQSNTRYCVLSTAHAMLHTFRSSAIRGCMGPSSIPLDALMTGHEMTIYAVMPVERMASHGVLLKLWLDVLLQVLLRRTEIPRLPTIVFVDEAGQIGTCPALMTVATYLRASGVRLWTFWQALSQLQRLYSDWPTLVNNCSAMTFMPGTGLAARELAALAGVAPSAVADLTAAQQLVCEVGREPVTVRLARYWNDAVFAGRFDRLPRFQSPEK